MSLLYPTLAKIPTTEDDEYCHEQLVPGSEVLVVQLEDGSERELMLPNGASSYELRVVGVAIIVKFFASNGDQIHDTEFLL
jgi:hypothetical protein